MKRVRTRCRRVAGNSHRRSREGRVGDIERTRLEGSLIHQERTRRDRGRAVHRNRIGVKRVRTRCRRVAGNFHRRSREGRVGDLKRTRIESGRTRREGTRRDRRLVVDLEVIDHVHRVLALKGRVARNFERRPRGRQRRIRKVDLIERAKSTVLDFDDVRIVGSENPGDAERRFAFEVERDARYGRRSGVVVREMEAVLVEIIFSRSIRRIELLDRDDVFRLVVTDVRNASLARQVRAPILRAENVEFERLSGVNVQLGKHGGRVERGVVVPDALVVVVVPISPVEGSQVHGTLTDDVTTERNSISVLFDELLEDIRVNPVLRIN